MNADFVRLAHRKAIWAEIQRLLLDKYVASDGPPKEEIICEEVPYAHKDVTNEAVLEVLEMIQQHELDENLEMRQYEFKKRERNAKREQEQPATDPQPDAEGPRVVGQPITRIAYGDVGPRSAAVPEPREPSPAAVGGQEKEGNAPAVAERESAPPSAHLADRKRPAPSR